MSFEHSSTSQSVPIRDPALLYHLHSNGTLLLPHRACNIADNHQQSIRIPLSIIKNRNDSTPSTKLQPKKQYVQDSPTVGFYDSSYIPPRTPDSTPSRRPRERYRSRRSTEESVTRSKTARHNGFHELEVPNKPTYLSQIREGIQTPEARQSQRVGHCRYGSAPARVYFNESEYSSNTSEWSPSKVRDRSPSSPLDKPLPKPPDGGDFYHAVEPRLQPSPPFRNSSDGSLVNKIRRPPKAPTPLRLFPPSPSGSLESYKVDQSITSPTNSFHPSLYLTQQVSVFEDDEEKVGLIDYLRWPLQGGRSERRSRLKKLKTRGGSPWRTIFCWPCGGRIG
jgi:hypothetical protein